MFYLDKVTVDRRQRYLCAELRDYDNREHMRDISRGPNSVKNIKHKFDEKEWEAFDVGKPIFETVSEWVSKKEKIEVNY